MVSVKYVRRLLLHTALVVGLSLLTLKVLLGDDFRIVKAPAERQELVTVQRWQRHRNEQSSFSPHDINRGDVASLRAVAPLGHYQDVVHDKEAGLCTHTTGADEVLFMIKTGATEAMERLPIHINTTLRCWPNAMVFSDFAEEINGVTIHDALDEVETGIRLHHRDFDLWRRLNASGRRGLTEKDFAKATTKKTSNKSGGDLGNAGWKIDKYKNLPMLEKALRKYPNSKWYIFADADTFMSQSNLMIWLHKLDHTQPLYLGNPSRIGMQTFGHGGSGYILSQAAMKAAATTYSNERGYWDNFAAQNWAGDHVLATMLQKRLKIPLTWSYPMLQAESPFTLDFMESKYSRKLWCYPSVSYHHVSPETIELLWGLERTWTAEHPTQLPMRHRDVFRQLVEPRVVASSGEDWDNMSDDAADSLYVGGPKTLEDCREICERNKTCVQYSLSKTGCSTSGSPKYGRSNQQGTRSGWLLDRIRAWVAEYDDCSDGRWIVP